MELYILHLEPGACSSASSASAAKAASEASATSESATKSSAEDDRASPATASSAVIVLSVALAALDHMAAVTTDVGDVFRLHTVVEGDHLATRTLQGMLLATRATCLASGSCNADGDGEEDEGKDDGNIEPSRRAHVARIPATMPSLQRSSFR